jgi:hypothetical protein
VGDHGVSASGHKEPFGLPTEILGAFAQVSMANAVEVQAICKRNAVVEKPPERLS